MEGMVDQVAGLIAMAIEVVMVLVIVIGSVRAIAAIAIRLEHAKRSPRQCRQIWLHYAAWILLALEFRARR